MEILKQGIDFQNDTYYLADRARYDVYLSDTLDGPSIHSVGDRVAFLVRDRKNVTLDFSGATLFLHGKIQPFFFENCENITVKNVIAQYDRSSVTEGVVTERGDGYLHIRLDPRHTCRIEDGQLIPYGESWENHELNKYVMFITATDPDTHEGLGFTLGLVGRDPWVSPDNLWSESATLFDRVEDLGNGEILLGGKTIPDAFRPGAILVFSHEKRTVSSLSCVDCVGLNIINYRILNGVSMGIMPIHTKNVHIDGLKMFHDDLSDALTTNGADGIHTFAISGEFLIENSRLEGMVDDAINIHSYFYRVEKVDGDRLTLVFPSKDDTRYKIFGDGERIRVYRGSTLSGGVDYVAKKVTVLDLHHIEILLDRPAEGHQPGDAVDNLDAKCDLTIRNCTFARSVVSHNRFQNGGRLLIEDCETTFPFWLTGDLSFWYESSYVPDCTIRRCRFVGDRADFWSIPEFFPTEEAPYYHRHVTIEDCVFDTETPLKVNYTESVTFRRNRNAKGLSMRGEMKNCGDFIGDGCEITRVTEKKDKLVMN